MQNLFNFRKAPIQQKIGNIQGGNDQMKREFDIGREKILETRVLPYVMRRFCAH